MKKKRRKRITVYLLNQVLCSFRMQKNYLRLFIALPTSVGEEDVLNPLATAATTKVAFEYQHHWQLISAFYCKWIDYISKWIFIDKHHDRSRKNTFLNGSYSQGGWILLIYTCLGFKRANVWMPGLDLTRDPRPYSLHIGTRHLLCIKHEILKLISNLRKVYV